MRYNIIWDVSFKHLGVGIKNVYPKCSKIRTGPKHVDIICWLPYTKGISQGVNIRKVFASFALARCALRRIINSNQVVPPILPSRYKPEMDLLPFVDQDPKIESKREGWKLWFVLDRGMYWCCISCKLKCFRNCNQILIELKTTWLVERDEAQNTEPGAVCALHLHPSLTPARWAFISPQQHFLNVTGPVIINKIG